MTPSVSEAIPMRVGHRAAEGGHTEQGCLSEVPKVTLAGRRVEGRLGLAADGKKIAAGRPRYSHYDCRGPLWAAGLKGSTSRPGRLREDSDQVLQ